MKILWIQSTKCGIAYWRVYNFCLGIHRNKLANTHVLWWNKKLTDIHPWQGRDPEIPGLNDPSVAYAITGEMLMYAREADVVIFQLLHTQEALAAYRDLKDAFPNKPIVVEIDDDIFNAPAYSPAFEGYQQGSEFRDIAMSQVKDADAMIVSTPRLKEVYSDYCEHIYVIPNSIDFEVWDRVQHKNRKKDAVIFGWAGGATHAGDLQIIEGAVRCVLESRNDVIFRFLHGVPDFFKGVDGVTVVPKWSRIDKYPQFLASQGFDVFLAPIQHNNFNLGKSNLRWLEGSALRLPTIASNVGHFAETIRNGVDGVLVEDEQWEKAINAFADDRAMRKEMAKAANTRISNDFNLDQTSRSYVTALEEVVDRGRVKDPMPFKEPANDPL